MSKQILIDYDEYLELERKSKLVDNIKTGITTYESSSPLSINPLAKEVLVKINREKAIKLFCLPMFPPDKLKISVKVEED